jgi:hypothetical protein
VASVRKEIGLRGSEDTETKGVEEDFTQQLRSFVALPNRSDWATGAPQDDKYCCWWAKSVSCAGFPLCRLALSLEGVCMWDLGFFFYGVREPCSRFLAKHNAATKRPAAALLPPSLHFNHNESHVQPTGRPILSRAMRKGGLLLLVFLCRMPHMPRLHGLLGFASRAAVHGTRATFP